MSFQILDQFNGNYELILFDKWMPPKCLYGCHSVI
jgi:hypothetical protein